MSDFGHAEALKLKVPPDVLRLLEQGLAAMRREN
jgi:hypothetical protein